MNEIGKELAAWLQKQATRLKRLVDESWKLKTAYLENARKRGAVLLGVEARLRGTSMNLKEWVEKYTDIGYSTALLWKDVAANYDLVEKQFADSNPLELRLTEVRDAIRDARQAQGRGKPGSGRRRTTGISPAPGSAEDEEAQGTDGAEQEDTTDDEASEEQVQQEAVNIGRKTSAQDIAECNYKKLMDRFKPGGDMHKGGDTKKATVPSRYKVTVVTPAKPDLERFGELLPSPITDFNAHSVFGWVRPQDIDNTLAAVGKALSVAQPKKVRVVVEL